MNQLSGGKGSDERSSPHLVQQLPIILQMNLNEQKTKTMLIIHGAISRNIFFPENDFWVKKYLAYNAYKKGK